MTPVPPAFAGEKRGAGRWTGGGRVLLHLQRDLQQKRLRRDGTTFLSPPKGYFSMTYYLNIEVICLINNYQYSPIRGPHCCAPTTKDVSGQAGAERKMSGGSVCDRLARPSADPGHTTLIPPRVKAPARKASGRRRGPRRARSRI